MSIEPTCYYCNQSTKGRCRSYDMALTCPDYPPNVEKHLIDKNNNLVNEFERELKRFFNTHSCASNENDVMMHSKCDFEMIAKHFIKKFNIK